MFGGLRLGLMGTPMDSTYGSNYGGTQMSGNSMSNMNILGGLTGKTGNPMVPVGGGGVTGGQMNLYGGSGGFGYGSGPGSYGG